ncbi:TPA: hypothetical protein JHJ64_004565 [Enterobacter cloacae]|uniref:hypothetical protein n=1 Tax=Enterobacter hormaechei TaxID=158836 RepID=UPI00223F797A|nr:hypothetical protein [Enterobacter hormaechei]WLZ47509.1 hypothetical protein QPR64_23580 [Enterobacter hormaechei]HAV2128654.1 hypothetical protein [Enterobacter cloacae]HBR4538448.1 hypothetical protein [Klebsiella pneumoniae]
MDNNMRPHLIDVFMKEYHSEMANNKAALEQRNRQNYQQRRLISFIQKSITKFKLLGFKYMEKPSITLNCISKDGCVFEFDAIPFEVTLKERNVRFVFTPICNSTGKLKYSFMRYNNEEKSFCLGELIWMNQKESVGSHWYLERNHGTVSLSSCIFDERGIEMLLTNMYSL